MTRLDVRLLGDFQVAVDSRPLPADAWPQRRAADLVKLLALAPRHRLTRDEVIDALWPQLDPAAGKANLHKAASYARKAIGDPAAVVLSGGHVALMPDGTVETDLQRLEAGDPDAYGGELLPDDRYEEWTLAHRERIDGLRADALRRARRWEEVIAADPVDEEAYRALMREAAEAGDRVAAVRWFRRLRDELSGLGLHPSEQTLSLIADISRGPAVTAAGLAGDEPVGREAELGALRETLDAAQTTGETIWISGPGGIGKTRLAEAALYEAAERGLHTLRGAAHADQEDAPYHAIVAALEPLITERPELVAQLPAAAQATLGALVSGARRGRAPDPPQGERHRIFTAVRDLVAQAARERPVVLLIDDLHAADAATVELVQHLARTAGRQRVILLVTARDDAPDRVAAARAALVRERVARVLEPAPLDTAATASLARRAAGRELPTETVRAIERSAAGNPLFIEELAVAAGDAALPARIDDVLAPTLERAESASGELLRWIAVADAGFSAEELAELAATGEPEVAAQLEAAVAAGLLEPTARGHRFRHPLLGEALRGRIPPRDLADAHSRAADVLLASDAPPERAAYHLLRAERAEEAVPLLVAAAEWAASVAAFGDGQRWLEEALEHADPAERSKLLALLARFRARTGDPRAAHTYEAAATAAGSAELPRLRLEQARALLGMGDVAGAERTLQGVQPQNDVEQGLLTLYEGFVAWYSGDFAGAHDRVNAAAPRIEAAGLPDEMLKVHELRAMLAHAGGHWTDHMHWQLGEVWALPEVAGVVFDAYLCVTEFALTAGAPQDTLIEYATGLRAHARRAGARRGEAYATTVLGEAALFAGDLRTAATRLAEAARLSREAGALTGESLARARLGEAFLHMGDREAARGEIDEALDLANASSLGDHLLYIAHSASVQVPADPREAAALVEQVDELLDRTSTCDFCPVGWWATGAAVAARGGDLALGRTLLERAEHGSRLRGAAAWRAALAEARGEVAVADGDEARGREQLRRAADAYAGAGHRLSVRRVENRLGAITTAVSSR